MPVYISYESEGFPTGTIPNDTRVLSVSWGDILHAAITVGRPDRYRVFRGNRSLVLILNRHRPLLYADYEALFRWSLIRMALEQRGLNSRYLHQTSSMKSLDRTEKGMVNYFIGMTFCKLFSEKLLKTPWLLHLDVFRDQLELVLQEGARPDLLGQESNSNRWHGFECKGRIQAMGPTGKRNAKNQAARLISVEGIPCTLHIGSMTHFRQDILHYYWCDPPSENSPGIELNLPEDAWEHYYRPVAEIVTNFRGIGSMDDEGLTRSDSEGNTFFRVSQCDLEIGVHRMLEEHLIAGRWSQARLAALEGTEQLTRDEFHADGLRINAGESWNERFEEARGIESPE